MSITKADIYWRFTEEETSFRLQQHLTGVVTKLIPVHSKTSEGMFISD